MKFHIAQILAIASTCAISQAATLYPVSVTSSSAGSDFRAASNLANGTGLNASELHEFGNFNTSWVTAGAGTDYFSPANPVTLTIDLGADVEFDIFKTWAYGGATGSGTSKQANSIRDFSLQFATAAEGTGGFGTSITLNPSFAASAANVPSNNTPSGNAIVADDYALGQNITARYIEMTITDNFSGESGFAGGDRAGLGAIGVNAVPEPSSAALLGLGGLALILRRRK